ncbi:MAG: acyl-CoA dehydrogenase [Candidatus Lokiarchaeota archaeon]|nr:acyl-CoA dehydrogenase [Candidatus Lokiarchaeota archaeon]
MNNIFFTREHFVLIEDLQCFLKEELEPIKDEITKEKKVPLSLIRKMGEKRYFGPLICENYGGSNLGMIAHCLITEEISKLNVSVSVTRTPCILDGYLLSHYGSDSQKQKYLTEITSGRKLCSICVTEEEAGSNVAGIKTIARDSGNEYILNGSKKYITNAGIADYYFIWCITNINVNPRSGMSVLLVEKDTPGLIIENPYELMGINGIYNGIIQLKDVRVPKENLIGNEGSGFDSLMDTFNLERITLSSECNGISLAALESSKQYAKKRVQFERPISNFQIIKLKLADMSINLQAARLLTYSAAKLYEIGLNITKEASMAKAFSSETAVKVASEAVQIHGGAGYTDLYSVERYLRDARFFQIGGGTSEIQKLIVAREELK